MEAIDLRAPVVLGVEHVAGVRFPDLPFPRRLGQRLPYRIFHAANSSPRIELVLQMCIRNVEILPILTLWP